jgi:hypothetical protein
LAKCNVSFLYSTVCDITFIKNPSSVAQEKKPADRQIEVFYYEFNALRASNV